MTISKRRDSLLRLIVLIVLIVSCIFSRAVPFLNISLGRFLLTPRHTVLLLTALLCLGQAVYALCRRRFAPLVRGRSLSLAALGFTVLWAGAALAWYLFGADWGDTASSELTGILELGLYALCFLFLVRDRADVRRGEVILLTCGVVLSVMADAEIVFGSFIAETAGNIPLSEKIALGRTLFPPSAVFTNTNDLAAFLLLCLCILLARILRRRPRRFTLPDGLMLLALLLPTPVMSSSIFQIALVVLAGILLVILIGLYRHRRKTLAGLCIGIPAALALYLVPFQRLVVKAGQALNSLYYAGVIRRAGGTGVDPNAAAKTDTIIDQFNTAAGGGGTIHIRMWLARVGGELFAQRPLFGGGPGGFRTFINAHPAYLQETRQIVDPHNYFVELLSEYGLVVFLPFAALLISLLARSIRRVAWEIRQDRPDTGVLCLLLTAAFLFAAVMPSSIIRISPIWLPLLLACAACDHGTEAPSTPSPEV